MTRKNLSKLRFLTLVGRRRPKKPLSASKIRVVNLDARNAVNVEIQAGRREDPAVARQ